MTMLPQALAQPPPIVVTLAGDLGFEPRLTDPESGHQLFCQS